MTPEAVPKSVTPTPTPRHAATPPAPPPAQQTPPPPPPPSRGSHSSSADKYTQQQQQNAVAMQALQQQLLRSMCRGGARVTVFFWKSFNLIFVLFLCRFDGWCTARCCTHATIQSAVLFLSNGDGTSGG